jgi:WS/DGAT/MGAT family acyltransferase
VVPSRRLYGPPYWADDPDFDLGYHLQRITLPPPGDQAALQDVVSLLAGLPLDLTRPLWQMHFVESYGCGCTLICRVHHSLVDGMGAMYVLLSMADADPGAPLFDMQQPPRPSVSSNSRRSRFKAGRQVAARLAREGLSLVSDPSRVAELARLGGDTATAAGDILRAPPDPDTVLKGAPSEPKRAAWSTPLPLPDIKAIGRQMDGTVNDVLLTAMTGALQRYLHGRGESLAGTGIRAVVPINFRQPGTEEELGNRIGIIFLPLPVEIKDPAERLHELKRRMDALKDSQEAPLIFAAMKALGSAPAALLNPLVNYLGTKATAVVTNVKGPQEQLYLAGAPLKEIMFWTPRFGGVGVGISILSYVGQVWLGIISDQDRVPDPGTIVSAFHEEFDALLALVPETETQEDHHGDAENTENTENQEISD